MTPMRLRLLRYLVASCALTTAASAEIQFVGILVTSNMTRFALSDTTTGRTDWVARGDRFAGHVVTDFDARSDTIVLKRDGAELRVRLVPEAKVKDSRLELCGTVTFGTTEKFEISRATLLVDRENVFPLKDGLTYRITPTRREDGAIAYRLSLDRVVSESTTEHLVAPAVIALPGQPFAVQIEDLAFSFAPR